MERFASASPFSLSYYYHSVVILSSFDQCFWNTLKHSWDIQGVLFEQERLLNGTLNSALPQQLKQMRVRTPGAPSFPFSITVHYDSTFLPSTLYLQKQIFPGKQSSGTGEQNRAGRSLRMYSTERKSSRSPSVRSRAEKGRNRHGWGKRRWSN